MRLTLVETVGFGNDPFPVPTFLLDTVLVKVSTEIKN